MDKIRNIGARGSSLQRMPRLRIEDRPERIGTSLQLRFKSYIPSML
jgi:hypothetical protein